MDSSVHNSSNASLASSAVFLRRVRMSLVRHHFCDNHACIMVKVRTKKAWNGTGELFLPPWHSVSSTHAETTSGVSEEEAHSWFSCTGYCVVSSCGSLRSCGCIILYRSVYNLLKGSSKRSQHCWPTRRNIVGPNMLRAFAHHVVCCCDLLEVVG